MQCDPPMLLGLTWYGDCWALDLAVAELRGELGGLLFQFILNASSALRGAGRHQKEAHNNHCRDSTHLT